MGVRIRPARYSQAELQAAMARVQAAASAGGTVTDMQSIAMRVDGSGLVVERMPASTATAVRAKAAAAARRMVTAALGGDSGGPVFTLVGTTGVRAKGIVSGASSGGSTLIWQDWADVISSFNAYPVTG